MKKIIFMLVLVSSVAATITSCKKDKKTDKEQALEYLTSGKWYYQSFKSKASTTANTCFNASNYWEFKTDGTFTDTFDFGSGTYTLSEDGKSLALKATDGNTFSIAISSLADNNFVFTLTYSISSFDFTVAKTALTCNPKKYL